VQTGTQVQTRRVPTVWQVQTGTQLHVQVAPTGSGEPQGKVEVMVCPYSFFM